MRTNACIFVLLLLVACGNETTEAPTAPGPTPPTLDELVLANCVAVQEAAEAYVAANNGEYPDSWGNLNGNGETLIDFLPDGSLLVNPATRMATEPAFAFPLTGADPERGSVVYRTLYDMSLTTYQMIPAGYYIVGKGQSEDIVLTNVPAAVLQKELDVIQNSENIVAAVEAFALENDGAYPHGLSTHLNKAGKNVIDYLPAGMLLINPYTMARTEPVGGAAAAIGSTGFIPVDSNGDSANDGYLIDGMSDDYRTAIFCAYVRAHAPASCWD